jgi:hypothetical protein
MPKKQKYIVLIVCLVILAFIIFLKAEKAYSPQNNNKGVLPPQTENMLSATVVIDKETLPLTFTQGESLYNILLKEKEKNNLSFSGKDYPGMGFFTTDIGTLQSNKDHYLMYYINGKEAEVGISSYLPQNGDVIEWKLK